MCCHAYAVLKSVLDPSLEPSLPEAETERRPDVERRPDAERRPGPGPEPEPGPGPGPEPGPAENHVKGYLMAIRYALSHPVENLNRSSSPLDPKLEKYKH